MEMYDPFFIIIAVWLVYSLISGLYFLSKTKSFVKNSSKAKANVVAVEIEGKGKNAVQKISIKFRDQYGKEIFSYIRGGLKPCKEGDLIDILYLKTDSQKVRRDDWFSLYGVPASIFVSAILVPILGILASK